LGWTWLGRRGVAVGLRVGCGGLLRLVR
jgi:hypothetical protein